MFYFNFSGICIVGCAVVFYIKNRFSELKENYYNYKFYVNLLLTDGLKIKMLDPLCVTPELARIAVKQNGLAIQYVLPIFVNDKSFCNQLFRMAIENNGLAIQYIENPSSFLALQAVKQNWRAIQFIKKQTKKICMTALKKSYRALRFIKNQQHDYCIKAMKTNPKAFKYIRKQEEEYCYVVLCICPNMFPFIENPTIEMCELAVQANPNLWKWIPQDLRSESLRQVLIYHHQSHIHYTDINLLLSIPPLKNKIKKVSSPISLTNEDEQSINSIKSDQSYCMISTKEQTEKAMQIFKNAPPSLTIKEMHQAMSKHD